MLGLIKKIQVEGREDPAITLGACPFCSFQPEKVTFGTEMNPRVIEWKCPCGEHKIVSQLSAPEKSAPRFDPHREASFDYAINLDPPPPAGEGGVEDG